MHASHDQRDQRACAPHGWPASGCAPLTLAVCSWPDTVVDHSPCLGGVGGTHGTVACMPCQARARAPCADRSVAEMHESSQPRQTHRKDTHTDGVVWCGGLLDCGRERHPTPRCVHACMHGLPCLRHARSDDLVTPHHYHACAGVCKRGARSCRVCAGRLLARVHASHVCARTVPCGCTAHASKQPCLHHTMQTDCRARGMGMHVWAAGPRHAHWQGCTRRSARARMMDRTWQQPGKPRNGPTQAHTGHTGSNTTKEPPGGRRHAAAGRVGAIHRNGGQPGDHPTACPNPEPPRTRPQTRMHDPKRNAERTRTHPNGKNDAGTKRRLDGKRQQGLTYTRKSHEGRTGNARGTGKMHEGQAGPDKTSKTLRHPGFLRDLSLSTNGAQW
jgi:hypothetical protein